WMIPVMSVLTVLAVVILVTARVAPRLRVKAPSTRFLLPAVGAGVLALSLAPTVWAITPILQSKQADTLVAGPAQTDGFGSTFGGGGSNNDNGNSVLIHYLEANQGTTTFLVAVPSSMTADGIILATNKPVMALGGFSGSDPILTTNQLASLVKNGTVRFFLINGGRGQIPQQILNQIPQQFRSQSQQALKQGGGPGGCGGQAALTTWR